MLLALFVASTPAPAATRLIVAPSSLATAEGDRTFGVNLAVTVQQLYGASQLAGLSPGDQITGMQLRLSSNEPTGPTGVLTASNFDVYLGPSNFPVGSLSDSVAGNQGPGTTRTRSGALSISPLSFPGGPGPNNFGPLIPFTTPYTYTSDSLLLTLSYSNLNPNGSTLLFDAGSGLTDVQARQGLGYAHPLLEFSLPSGYGVAVQFTTVPVPEPASVVLVGVGLVGIGAASRRRIRQHVVNVVEILEQRRLLSFSPAVSYPVAANPLSVVTGDFNNDGKMDLATANSNSVSVLLGDGHGGFGAARQSAVGHNISSLVAADFNKDGKFDLAWVNNYTENGYTNLNVALSNGDGTFKTPTYPTVEWGPLTLAVGDFNHDGKSDIAISEDDYNSFGYFEALLGDGKGGFTQAEGQYNSYPTSGGLAVGDLDRDGALDVITSLGYGAFSLMNTGAGSFTGYDHRYGYLETGPAMAVGDFTGDGIPDVVSGGFGSVFILPGRGDGDFDHPVGAISGGAGSLAVADFNGDGKLDAVASAGDTLSLVLGNGDGTLRYRGSFAVGSAPSGVATGDFNRDGRPDVAVANMSSNNVSVLINDGNWAAKIYVGPNGSNWSTAGNWSPSGVPTASDQVMISGKSVNLLADATLANLTLTAGASLSVAANGNRVLRASTLSISADSKLDLNDNALVLNSQPASAVANYLTSGYANGAWNGYGICSSPAASIPQRAIGYAQASDLFGTFPATFQGQSVNASDVLIRYTLSGDANLDGRVNSVDFASIAMNFNQTGRRWSQGDFNYDGKVNALDFNALASKYGSSLAAGSAASADSASFLVSVTAAPRDALFSNDRINRFEQLELEDSFV